MAPRMSESSKRADEIRTAGLPSFLTSGVIDVGFEIDECEPISQKEFRMLMAFVVIATFAFGCIVNGWLL